MYNLISENIRPLPYVPLWIVIILFVQTTLLTYLYLYSKKIIFIPFLALTDNRIRREITESRSSFQIRLLNLLDVLFYLNFAFLIFYLLKHNNFSLTLYLPKLNNLNPKIQDIIYYSLILFFSVLIVFIKKQSFLLISYLFDETSRYNVFVFNLNMLLKTIGFLTFPIVFLISWKLILTANLVYFLLAILVTLYYFLMIISFLSIPHKTFIDYMNFILYLCALEIIPLLLSLKLLPFI